jgi:hypothetical protein
VSREPCAHALYIIKLGLLVLSLAGQCAQFVFRRAVSVPKREREGRNHQDIQPIRPGSSPPPRMALNHLWQRIDIGYREVGRLIVSEFRDDPRPVLSRLPRTAGMM